MVNLWMLVLYLMAFVLHTSGQFDTSPGGILLEFKSRLIDRTDRLQTWGASSDVCGWLGVTCDNKIVIRLSLSAKSLQGSISEAITRLNSLRELDLSFNALNGPIPVSLGNLQNLQTLNIRNNQLTGGIPSSVQNLTSLQMLRLSTNSLTGSIPSVLVTLPRLHELYLDDNNFSGTLPPNIGSLNRLRIIDLSFNNLVGTIPTSFGSLKRLEDVNLRNNFLTGNFTIDLQSLADVKIDVSYNYLSGTSVSVNGNPACAFVKNNCFDDISCKNSTSSRRPISECERFCNATQPMGVCGGHGYCTALDVPCICDEGYSTSVDNSICSFEGRGLGLATLSRFNYTKLNRYFRYASSGYLIPDDDSKASWLVATNWNWVKRGAVTAIKDQQNCNICWLFASISTIESAYYIANGGALDVPTISENQIFNCSSLARDCSAGGWPIEAFDYASNNPLMLTSKYIPGNCPGGQIDGNLMIQSFERVQLDGWLGLLLALQQQTAVVGIEASGSTFLNYDPKMGVFSDEDCFSDGVDHAVVVVGYDLTYNPPYWLIRNSWGPTWGDKGYMRLKIAGGPGICGINTLPVLVPIVKLPLDPCNHNNFVKNKLNARYGPGRMNPCGNGVCIPSGSTNLCRCSDNFVAVTNTDGSQTCAPANPCTFASKNRCGVGICINSVRYPGTYLCVCPIGYSSSDTDGLLTCVPAVILGDRQNFYTVPESGNVTCNAIRNAYGISQDDFTKQNLKLDCDVPLLSGTIVNVTAYRNCSLPYTVTEDDSCDSIQQMFNLTALSGIDSPNPDLDCSELQPFHQVCIIRGDLPYPLPCVKFYQVKPEDTCSSIIANLMDPDVEKTDAKKLENVIKFYTLNVGIFCSRIDSYITTVAGYNDEVCLEEGDLGKILKGCKQKAIKLTQTTSCSSLKKCFKKPDTFKSLNKMSCTNRFLGSLLKKSNPTICVSKASKCK